MQSGRLTEQRIESIPQESEPAACRLLPTTGGRGRHGIARAGKQGPLSAPEPGILHQTVNKLPVANYIFLGSWMLTYVRRVTASYMLSRGGTWRTWNAAIAPHPGNWVAGTQAAGTGEVIKTQEPHQEPGHLSCLDLGRAQNACLTESVPP